MKTLNKVTVEYLMQRGAEIQPPRNRIKNKDFRYFKVDVHDPEGKFVSVEGYRALRSTVRNLLPAGVVLLEIFPSHFVAAIPRPETGGMPVEPVQAVEPAPTKKMEDAPFGVGILS